MRSDLFLPEADEEFREAARYYESEAPGLGIAFITEVHSAVASVLANPYAAAAAGSGIRQRVLHRFPYNVLYAVEKDTIVIVAVAHQKRRPGYWKARLKQLESP